ncbi:MAG: MoxR family ATPase [candidate division Zixibacteria bacterium]|nr:MoxR family ATPase [candidate division Zixibacteria bacterium]MBU1471275.1 MoxR family ATPase [candidate division Zixibacteria bacterium]MBU2625788.1 MoxR family ATPase [candidate division Zixibacteria bacterium]
MADDVSQSKDIQAVEKLQQARSRIKSEIAKVIIGQETVIDELLISILSNGHVLLIGVPGLAKTLLVSTLSKILELKFSRIQFTPDLMPSDITGTEIIEEDKTSGKRTFKFIKGPVFANIVLADEINRTPPKTQAALLQAMQEHEVTAAGETYTLEEPFFVLATQNPIEQEGTYPLPEAQLDRFMFNIMIDYPSEAEEQRIVKTTTAIQDWDLTNVLGGDDISELQNLVRRVPVSDHVIEYAVKLVRATRPGRDGVPEYVRNWVSWGAGPRASQYLILGAKTKAVLDGRYTPSVEDVKSVAKPVLRHRIVTSFNAEADGVGPSEIVDRLLEEVKEK